MGKGDFRLVRTSILRPAQRVSIIRSQLNITQKYLPTTDGAGRIKDKVKANLVGGGDCQDRSKYSEAETSIPKGGTLSISHITHIAADEIEEWREIDHLRNPHQENLDSPLPPSGVPSLCP
jgi:hypothetical protein